MIRKEDLNKGLIVELKESLNGRDSGLIGEVQDLETVDYDISSIWIYWSDLKKLDRFDLTYEPNILNKLVLYK